MQCVYTYGSEITFVAKGVSLIFFSVTVNAKESVLCQKLCDLTEF
jgi:hypothetical protein